MAMRHRKRVVVSLPHKLLLLVSLVLAAACSGGNTEPASSRNDSAAPEAAKLVRLAIASPTQSLEVGKSEQFSAVGYLDDSTNLDLTLDVTWSSSEPSVLQITASGLITGRGVGDAQVTATHSMGLRDSLDVRVTQRQAEPIKVGLQLALPSSQMFVGDVTNLTAIAIYSNGTTSAVTDSVAWASSEPGVAPVEAGGILRASSVGSTRVSVLDAASGLMASAWMFVSVPAPALTEVSEQQWDALAVRKVLHTFAYGAHASDVQIEAWAGMPPRDAIAQMLSFDPVNELLAPATLHFSTGALADLQAVLGSDDLGNPLRWDRRRFYATLNTDANGAPLSVSPRNLQRAWVMAVVSGGSNPFLHKVAFFLSNYQMALRASVATPGLMRSYYDQIVLDLASTTPFTTLIANAAQSAAIAMRYGHRNNRFDNWTLEFSGNDDFAREYFQLFFRLLGETEDADYHEGVTIENNAKLLTGFQVDRRSGAYGSPANQDWVVAPIVFGDHADSTGSPRNNATWHHASCLEILRQSICGATAADKIAALSPVAAHHPEALDNLPTYIAGHFADDRLTGEKIQALRRAWIDSNDNLLEFLRSYAVSQIFHSRQRVKFASAFDRNLTLLNYALIDDEELYLGRDEVDSVLTPMEEQGGVVFEPAHAVFGGQTGDEASLNAGILKTALETALETHKGLSRLESDYPLPDGGVARWTKNWAALVPAIDSPANYRTALVADWLWNRMVVDDGANLDIVARAHIHALLSRGVDFSYLADSVTGAGMDFPYTAQDILDDSDLLQLVNALGNEAIELTSTEAATRLEANRRVNLAVGFISALPFTFATEGR